MRLIDADAFKTQVELNAPTLGQGGLIVKSWVWAALQSENVCPTVDAVPVKHGRWIDKGLDIVCSACGIRYSYELPYMSRLSTPGSWDMEGFEYCPHCGAKMDGERRESE